jgi:hypothetical protein
MGAGDMTRNNNNMFALRDTLEAEYRIIDSLAAEVERLAVVAERAGAALSVPSDLAQALVADSRAARALLSRLGVRP